MRIKRIKRETSRKIFAEVKKQTGDSFINPQAVFKELLIEIKKGKLPLTEPRLKKEIARILMEKERAAWRGNLSRRELR